MSWFCSRRRPAFFSKALGKEQAEHSSLNLPRLSFLLCWPTTTSCSCRRRRCRQSPCQKRRRRRRDGEQSAVVARALKSTAAVSPSPSQMGDEPSRGRMPPSRRSRVSLARRPGDLNRYTRTREKERERRGDRAFLVFLEDNEKIDLPPFSSSSSPSASFTFSLFLRSELAKSQKTS